MKKGIFTVLNYILPEDKKVLSMHCSTNIGKDGDTALFFGLSGTGKTTLSADPYRKLIGDDEHGWSDDEVFNFEGGCYAKVINLSQEQEPEIFGAISYGAILENTRFEEGSIHVDYANMSVTENTRTAYPINYIPNVAMPSIGSSPKNIFFLTADAFGVLPPISKLTVEHRKQIAAGYILYGSSTIMVYITGKGVNAFTYQNSLGEYFLSHANIKMPSDGKIYSVNEAYFHDFMNPVKEFIEDMRNKSGCMARYIGSLVGDFHRNLLKGGISL